MRIEQPNLEQIPTLRRLWQTAFRDSEGFLDSFFSTAFAPERCRCVTIGGEPAAVLYWLDMTCSGQKIAYIYAVATDTAYRNQGLCRKLMADTHALLAHRGYASAVLCPAGEGLTQMYANMGYVPCCGISRLRCTAQTEPVPVRSVDPGEYQSLREMLLPPGGVALGSEALAFLATQAELFAGTDFLLTALRQGDALLGIELLGNRHTAPGILAALDCGRGSFCVPGSGEPFAMYYPLTPNAQKPTYFGIAFD